MDEGLKILKIHIGERHLYYIKCLTLQIFQKASLKKYVYILQ
jgi:hypothetical protein